jgi:flagellar biosynthesis protein FlhB
MGDPYMRSRLREMQRELVMKNMIKEVPRADVVVTNPTHYSIAMRYDRTVMDAPTVIAKGADSMALKIREIAKENNIPLIQNRPLAQEMYKRIDVGDIIPEDLFYAVSLVYAELYRKKQYKEAI